MNTDGAKWGMRSRSTRKPLRDVSNAYILKKKSEDDTGQMGDDPLDRLLLVQSDLSSLVRKIDELVVQALQLTGNTGKKEIEHFADLLSDMQTSLEPWVPILQKALLSSQSTAPENKSDHPTEIPVLCVQDKVKNTVIESPVQSSKFDSLVSPSPLVSWRAECNTAGGRQLFLLTPLPQNRALRSKCPKSSFISTFENVKGAEKGNHPKCGTPAKFSETDRSVFVMTPRLKMSPPKSCILLEPISEFAKKKNIRAHKSTPFPARVQDSSDSEDSEFSSSSQSSDNLAVKYPELFGIRMNNLEKRMVEEESPDWVGSPPMTCAIMEPTDDELLKMMPVNCLAPKISAVCNHGDEEGEDDHVIATKTVLRIHTGGIRGATGLAESTPMSSFRMGKQPGENTLKKELWTRFEAASIRVISFEEDSILEDCNATKKQFLDRLDEVLDL